jgi:hypothetical protein
MVVVFTFTIVKVKTKECVCLSKNLKDMGTISREGFPEFESNKVASNLKFF